VLGALATHGLIDILQWFGVGPCTALSGVARTAIPERPCPMAAAGKGRVWIADDSALAPAELEGERGKRIRRPARPFSLTRQVPGRAGWSCMGSEGALVLGSDNRRIYSTVPVVQAAGSGPLQLLLRIQRSPSPKTWWNLADWRWLASTRAWSDSVRRERPIAAGPGRGYRSQTLCDAPCWLLKQEKRQ